MKHFFILILVFIFISSCYVKKKPEQEINPSMVLWYDEPASEWTQALPLGNGHVGAMVYGNPVHEIIQFNEETLWTGQPHSYANEGAASYLSQIRDLLWQGKQDEAERLANEQFMSEPLGQQAYQPFGRILLEFPDDDDEITEYRRQLDLSNAISTVSYKRGRAWFKREMFASHPDKALVIRLEASGRRKISFRAGLDSPHREHQVRLNGNEVILTGEANDYPKNPNSNVDYPESRLRFEARLRVLINDGKMRLKNDYLEIEDANQVTIYLVAATSFMQYDNISANPEIRCLDILNKLHGKTYKDLRSEHIRDYQSLFNRVSLSLGQTKQSVRPTDERLVSFAEDQDPSLVSLLYQYGRYLLISSSREGSQPANLQGIWNNKLDPPWDSKYTININTEMNYWPAEITNLSECAWPLIRMVEDLSVTGWDVAQKHYNLNGWVAHHNTDLWRGAAPINNADHGIWPTGGAWLSQHLWWHYIFSGDMDYLKNTAYPILKEASRFFSEYLVPDPKNPEWLVSGPSNSPELGGLVMGPTMDHQIIRELMSNTIEAAVVLGVDSTFINMLQEKRARLTPNQIGRLGQLQEWLEDKDDPSNQHRHVSHLWALHPGNEIHPRITPDLAQACRVTLKHRGDGGTGWSRAWKINFWARLLDGDHAFLLLKNLMVPSFGAETNYEDKGGLYPNLFDSHPPFQIDGNFGAVSGITEMLLQSHLRDQSGAYYQDLLPALPSAFPSGKISGIKGRGGFEISMEWAAGTLNSVKVKSLLGNKMNLRYGEKIISRETTAGESYVFGLKDF